MAVRAYHTAELGVTGRRLPVSAESVPSTRLRASPEQSEGTGREPPLT